MATVTYIKEHCQSVGAMRAVIAYCQREDKTVDPVTGQRFVSGIHCDGLNAATEFMATKGAYHKLDGIHFYQYVQSFSPKENLTYQQAHQIALEFAEKAWPGYEVLVTTHCNTAHPHSHFIINSVSYETGKKLRQDPNTLRQLRALSDEVCMAHGLNILPPYRKGGQKLSAREYRAAQKGQSWKFRLMFTINKAMEKSAGREDFIKLMNRAGYQVSWTDDRKYITFTCPNGMKCRCNKLHDEKYLKENLENEFTVRQQHLLGKPDPEQCSGDGRNPGNTVPTNRVCGAQSVAGKLDEAAGAGSRVPAYALSDDFPADNPAGAGADARAAAADSAGREAGGTKENRPNAPTGWEREREIFLRYVQTAIRKSQGYGGYRPAFGEADLETGGIDLHPFGGAVSLGLRGAAALGRVADAESDDPEERRRQQEAQQAASNLGAVIGLTTGAIMALKREEREALEQEEYNEFIAEQKQRESLRMG
ncbi:MAG: relaxase/mobilization nuclease domain-containing protein [Eubacteriales bacterium]|nr:relaxase/mobilization nuclease domain-containing protein [Eubacteriales bacterium]